MKVSENISLRPFNSFGVEARAARLVEWERPDELASIPFEGRWLALGGGNNILFMGDYDGTLVKSAARGIEITGKKGSKTHVRAEAGVDWDDFAVWCAGQGLWGVENLSGIPGTVGAAPVQNIGAYGAEAGDVIGSVECFATETGAALTLAADHCGFGYRDSVFKRSLAGRVIVTAVNFTLHAEPRPDLRYAALAEQELRLRTAGGGKDSEPTLESIRRAVIETRGGKLPDPKTTGNAGSFFKNPVVEASIAHSIAARHPGMPLYPAAENGRIKLAAGWLIEQAGWRGRSEGRVGIHPLQALVIVNLGGATGREIADFALRVQRDVESKFGVALTPEVNIIEEQTDRKRC